MTRYALCIVNYELLEHHFLAARQAILDALHYDVQILVVMDKIQVVTANRQHGACVKIGQPLVVVAIEQAQIIGRDGGLHRAAAARDPIDQRLDRRAQIDQQRGRGQ